MTTRQSILNHYELALLTLKTSGVLKNVIVNKIDSRDLRDTKLPAAFIYSGSETRAGFEYGKEYWDWDIVVQVWAKDEEMEELLSQVNKALWTRYRAERFVENFYKTDAALWVVDANKNLQGWNLIFKNFYRTEKGET